MNLIFYYVMLPAVCQSHVRVLPFVRHIVRFLLSLIIPFVLCSIRHTEHDKVKGLCNARYRVLHTYTSCGSNDGRRHFCSVAVQFSTTYRDIKMSWYYGSYICNFRWRSGEFSTKNQRFFFTFSRAVLKPFICLCRKCS